MNLLKKDELVILGTYSRLPVEVAYARGVYLYDIDKKSYLDFASGIAVNALGYGHEVIQKAISEQSKKFLHLSNYFACSSVVELAKKLKENSFAEKVFFSNSGTEANEAMIKAARKWGRSIHERKTKFIAIRNGFHGRTMGAMSLAGKEQYHLNFAPLMPHVIHVDANDVEGLLSHSHEDICGIFFEIILGEAGVLELSEAFIKAIEKVAKMSNALILVDEIQTGLMRTGTLFAYEYFDIKPDMMTLSKALGGGLPLGAMLVSKRLESVLASGDHGSTFGGNPLSAATGEALLSFILEKSFQKRLGCVSRYLIDSLLALQKKHPEKIHHISGRGLMLGINLGEKAMTVRDRCLEKGVILNVTSQHVIRLLPPLIIEKKHIDQMIQCLDEVLLFLK